MTFTIVYTVVLAICYNLDANLNQKFGLKQNERKLGYSLHFVFLCFLTLVFAYRSLETGPDTRGYALTFYGSDDISFRSLINNGDMRKEYLFYIITKIIAGFTEETVIYFGLYGALFIFTYGKMIQKTSENYFISYLLFLVMYLSFAISGMRQMAAMSILFISFRFIKEQKLFAFLCCVFVAYFFHNTSIIFLLAYPIARARFSTKMYAILIGCIVMALAFPDISKTILYDWLAWDRIAMYETYGYTLSMSGFYIKLCILIFNLFFYTNTVKHNPENEMLYNLSIVGVALESFTVVMSQAFRVSFYFSIFDTILTANVLSAMPTESEDERTTKKIITILVICACLFYYLYITTPMAYEIVER